MKIAEMKTEPTLLEGEFYWDFQDGSRVKFLIKDVTEETKRTMLEMARKRVEGWRGAKSDDPLAAIDIEKFNKMLILKSVTGWEGLKNKHLLRILNTQSKSGKWNFKGDGKAETDIPFDPENLRELAEMYSPNFIIFLTAGLETLAEQYIAQKELELKN